MNRIPAVLVHFRMSSSVGRGTRIIGIPHAVHGTTDIEGSVPDHRASSLYRRTLELDALALDDDPPRLDVEHAVTGDALRRLARRMPARLYLPGDLTFTQPFEPFRGPNDHLSIRLTDGATLPTPPKFRVLPFPHARRPRVHVKIVRLEGGGFSTQAVIGRAAPRERGDVLRCGRESIRGATRGGGPQGRRLRSPGQHKES